MPNLNLHPSRDELRRFAAAALSDANEMRISEHCAACPDCQRALDEIEQTQAGRFPLGLHDTQQLPTAKTLDPGEIGPYKVLRQIDKGGMGVVFLAEQRKPMRRKVAVKLIKLGMDTREVLTRFDIERQALALMDHANIASVYDAGSTADGRPYFVMEYVNGVPITNYCNSHRLSVRERLELFIQVCDAVRHAHQKGIIHRDIKPSNLLVTRQDAVALPKIIDFGIAKATGHQLSEATFFTREGAIVGTPEYMSPEQIDFARQDVDTRSDVYSLGVVLYELLAGQRPFRLSGVSKSDLVQIQRIICNQEPKKPSMCVTRHENLSEVAAERGTSRRDLVRQLQGELDWITIKTLEKNPARRYESAAALASDLRRYLTNQAVEARPPSAAYLVEKFIRRNRILVTSGAALLLVLVSALGAISMFAIGERRARLEAARQARIAESVTEFLTEDFFEKASPVHEPDRDISFREVLDRAADNLEGSLADEPEPKAKLLTVLGKVYFDLGDYQRSRQLFADAYGVASPALGDEHTLSMKALDQLGKVLMRLGRYEKAEEVLQKALVLQRKVLGPEHEDTIHTYAKMGDLYGDTGRIDEAVRITEEVLEIRRRLWGDRYEFTLVSLNGLGLLYRAQGRYAKAVFCFEDARRISAETQSTEHPYYVTYCYNLALAYLDVRQPKKAEGLAEECLRIRQKILPEGHLSTFYAKYLLATVQRQLGDLDESLAGFERIKDYVASSLPINHRFRAAVLMQYGGCLSDLKRFEEAEPVLKESYSLRLEKLGAEHTHTQNSAQELATLYDRWNNAEEARRWRERTNTGSY